MNSRRSRILKNVLIYIFIIVLTIEVFPFLTGSLFLEEGYSRKKIANELKVRAETRTDSLEPTQNNPEGYLSEHLVHPYLGFIHTPEEPYNSYGFLFSDPLPKQSDGSVNVCITGGSVAKQLVQFSSSTLIQKLKESPVFEDKEINLVVLALGGFKQPQQMLALSYFRGMGAFFDLVINLDGFNEVVLPYSDNLPFGIHPTFPRHWNIYARKTLNKKSVLLLGKQTALKEKQTKRARDLLTSPFRVSNAALFLWKIVDQEMQRAIHAIEIDLRDNLSKSPTDPQITGPAANFSDTLDFFQQQAVHWANCSRIMHQMTQVQGGQYFHFLQPNQYVEGSKQLTEEEYTLAFQEGDFAYKTAVRTAYPMLIQEGKKLQAEGVNFSDLTLLFETTRHTVYSDKCCHLNKAGYDTMVSEIINTINRSSEPEAVPSDR